MEKISSDVPKKKRNRFIGKIRESIQGSFSLRKGNKEAPFIDILVFVVALLFARCHVVFGAHPLAIAWLAILPSGVWVALIGSAVGSLTLGSSGVIYVVVSLIVVLLRVLVSSKDKRGGDGPRALFGERLLLRMSAGIIGGFVAAVYEVLLSGFGSATVLFGLTMILMPPIISFAFSGLFDTPIGFREVFKSETPIFSGKRRSDCTLSLIFFQVSALLLIFLLSFALRGLEVFGITFSYIFAGVLTLFCAKRFGAIRAAAVGFAATLAISPTYSVAYALCGLCAGGLFKLGLVYALIGSGCAVAAWGAYSGGLMGFLSVFPEFALSAIIASPIVGKLPGEPKAEAGVSYDVSARDMVGTMSLAYKSKCGGAMGGLESSLLRLSSVLSKHTPKDPLPRKEELCDLIAECADRYCSDCSGECGISARALKSGREKIADVLISNGSVTDKDLRAVGVTQCITQLAESINRAVAILTEEKYRLGAKDTFAEDMELISQLISDSRLIDEVERSPDAKLSAAVESAMKDMGLSSVSAAVFGRRKKHFILAAEDPDGSIISSAELRSKIELLSKIRLGEPEYFRRDRLALMECSAAKQFSAECAVATKSGRKDEVSGDTAKATECKCGQFLTILSDGMGSGECARETSRFVTDFIINSAESGTPRETVLKMLNNAIRRRHGECTASLDLCSVDLYNGECIFLKCGTAPSYIKRGTSVFRIKARTAPLGVLKSTDAEKIKSELCDGDFILMMSDGIIGSDEDSPWLIELLARISPGSTEELARAVLEGAMSNADGCDDMTAIAIRVKKI